MATAEITDLAALYESDETAWLDIMVGLVRAGRLDQIDSVNLAEFLESMGRRDRREVTSRLKVLMAHLLKWTYQPGFRSRSWRHTIDEQRQELVSILESGTLRAHATDDLAPAYKLAILRASAETGLSKATFPIACPYTVDSALTSPLEGEQA